jgi:prephenate dehydratase
MDDSPDSGGSPESRPTGVPWTYRFFLEVKHRRKEDTDRIQELLMVSATRIAVVGIFRTT